MIQANKTNLVQNSIRRLIASQALFAQMLMRLSQTFHFGEPSVQRHSRMIWVLGKIQISCTSQLFLNNKRLLQQLQKNKIKILKSPKETNTKNNKNHTLNLRAKNLFLISKKFPLPTSILNGSLIIAKRMSP